MEKTFSTKEISQIMGVSIRTVQRVIKEGKLRAFKMGRENRVFQSDFEEYLSTITNQNKDKGITFSTHWEQEEEPQTIIIKVPINNDGENNNDK